MRPPPLVAYILNAVCLFSFRSSRSENTAYLWPFNSPLVPVIDNDLPHERYSDVVRQLRPLFPSTCASFEPGEVKVIGDTPIAAGGFADILEGTFDGRSIIQKTYRCYEICDVRRIFRRYISEVWVLSQISHPNVVGFLGINSTPSHPFSLVLDSAGHCGLEEYLRKHPKVDRVKLVLGIARGLKHVHDLGIIHGRLSPSILVAPDGTPRITGFGSSFMISRPDLWPGDAGGFHRGSAPELIRSRKSGDPIIRISKATDMYSFAMLTWQIFAGKDPFSGDLDVTVVRRVLKGDRPSRPDHVGLSDRMWKVVKGCWHQLPSRRMTPAGKVVALIEAERASPASKHPS